MVGHRMFSTLLTVGVIAMLLLATPASAVELAITNLPATATNDGEVSFWLRADIESGERVPFTDVTLRITGPVNEMCTFDLQGNSIVCSLDISLKRFNATFTNGEMNGSGFDGTSQEDTFFGYGYGYGHARHEEIIWEVVWDVTGLPSGVYNLNYEIAAVGPLASRTFNTENSATIVLKEKAQPPSVPPGQAKKDEVSTSNGKSASAPGIQKKLDDGFSTGNGKVPPGLAKKGVTLP